MALQDDLYNTLLVSPLGVHGVEQTLPALSNLLRELRRKEFWDGRRLRRLSEEQMIRAWSTYRRDLKQLRERMRQRDQGWDDLLSWLAIFLLDHYKDLARVSALTQPAYKLILDGGDSAGLAPEEALAMRDDWQAWAVAWLPDALRDEALDERVPTGNSGAGSDTDGDASPELRPRPTPDPNHPSPDF